MPAGFLPTTPDTNPADQLLLLGLRGIKFSEITAVVSRPVPFFKKETLKLKSWKGSSGNEALY